MRSSPEIFCSREPPLLTQAGAVPRRRNGLAYFGPTGVQEQGAGTRGSLGNLRDPVVSVVTAGWSPGYQLQVDPQLPSRAGGDEQGTKRRYRQAKATKCGEMGGRESERPIVTLRRGNSTAGPRGVKGTPFQLTVGGKHGGCIGTRGRVHETTTDSGSRRLKRGAVCVNCASTDLWGAWVGDHPGLPGATKSGESDLENTESTSKRGKPTIVSSVFRGAEPCIRAPMAWPCP